MGYRTVVVLLNDKASVWEKDAQLGGKISHAMNYAMGGGQHEGASLGYGRVVECCHADQNTLGIFNSYGFTPLAHSEWHQGQESVEMTIKLLEEAAKNLGYQLVKRNAGS